MATNRIADMTVEEIQSFIRETVRQAVDEALQDLFTGFDPDAGLELRPEVAEYLKKFMESPEEGTPLSEVIKQLDLDTSD